MAIRTTSQAVRGAVQTTDAIAVDSYMETANAITDQIADNDSGSLLSDAMLKQIETYLAAHFYALFDRQYLENETGDAKAKYQGQDGKRFDATSWGQQAIAMDVTGWLQAATEGRKKASLTWLGKPPSEQIPYEERR